MINKALVSFPVIFLILLLAALPLAAQGHRGGAAQPGGNQTTPIPPTLKTVEGLVAAVAFEYGAGHPSFTLLDEVDGAPCVIYVGPLRYIEDSNFELSVGDRVSASIFQDPQSNDAWVAAVLTNLSTGDTITLRDAAGAPLWIHNRSSRAARSNPVIMRSQGLSTLRAGSPSIDLTTLAIYAGEVTKVNIAPGLRNPTIEVGTAIFCLAPYRYLSQIGFSVKVGDQVSIKAADCTQDTGDYVVFDFTNLTDGKAYPLRSSDGSPLWYFGR